VRLADEDGSKHMAQNTNDFITTLDNMTDTEVRDNFLDLFNQALGIEQSEQQQQAEASSDGISQ
jgi:hypothetical protein